MYMHNCEMSSKVIDSLTGGLSDLPDSEGIENGFFRDTDGVAAGPTG